MGWGFMIVELVVCAAVIVWSFILLKVGAHALMQLWLMHLIKTPQVNLYRVSVEKLQHRCAQSPCSLSEPTRHKAMPGPGTFCRRGREPSQADGNHWSVSAKQGVKTQLLFPCQADTDSSC
eukprot:919984-Pelagomonas_calceolata.AAC.7